MSYDDYMADQARRRAGTLASVNSAVQGAKGAYQGAMDTASRVGGEILGPDGFATDLARHASRVGGEIWNAPSTAAGIGTLGKHITQGYGGMAAAGTDAAVSAARQTRDALKTGFTGVPPTRGATKTPTGAPVATAVTPVAAPVAGAYPAGAAPTPQPAEGAAGFEGPVFRQGMEYLTGTPHAGGGPPSFNAGNVDVAELTRLAGGTKVPTDPYGKALYDIEMERANDRMNPIHAYNALLTQSNDPSKQGVGRAALAERSAALNARLQPMEQAAERLSPEGAHRQWIRDNEVAELEKIKSSEAEAKAVGSTLITNKVAPDTEQGQVLAGTMRELAETKGVPLGTLGPQERNALLREARQVELMRQYPQLMKFAEEQGLDHTAIKQVEGRSWWNPFGWFDDPYMLQVGDKTMDYGDVPAFRNYYTPQGQQL